MKYKTLVVTPEKNIITTSRKDLEETKGDKQPVAVPSLINQSSSLKPAVPLIFTGCQP